MLHYSCDICKRPINGGSEVRHVVKIEVFPAVDEQACDCGDADALAADADHLEEMQELLEQLDEDDVVDVEEATRSLRFDLCDACRQRFVKNPLGIRRGKQHDFSQN